MKNEQSHDDELQDVHRLKFHQRTVNRKVQPVAEIRCGQMQQISDSENQHQVTEALSQRRTHRCVVIPFPDGCEAEGKPVEHDKAGRHQTVDECKHFEEPHLFQIGLKPFIERVRFDHHDDGPATEGVNETEAMGFCRSGAHNFSGR